MTKATTITAHLSPGPVPGEGQVKLTIVTDDGQVRTELTDRPEFWRRYLTQDLGWTLERGSERGLLWRARPPG